MSSPRPSLLGALCALVFALGASAEPAALASDADPSERFTVPPLAAIAKLPVTLSQKFHGQERADLARQRAELQAGRAEDPRGLVFRTQRAGPVFVPTAHARPVSGTRARSQNIGGVGFWAAGNGFAVGRRSAGYGVECGAAVPVGERLGITAGYRIAGFARGDRLDAAISEVEARIGAPFVGLDLRF
ncbi:MAG: hypothetical protein AAF430_04990 [Myxococcota bacterium]